MLSSRTENDERTRFRSISRSAGTSSRCGIEDKGTFFTLIQLQYTLQSSARSWLGVQGREYGEAEEKGKRGGAFSVSNNIHLFEYLHNFVQPPRCAPQLFPMPPRLVADVYPRAAGLVRVGRALCGAGRSAPFRVRSGLALCA